MLELQVDEFAGMMDVLKHLDLGGGCPALSGDVADYIIKYSGHDYTWSDGTALDDELMDMTEEEMRIMNVYDPGYKRWYGDKLDDLILGEDDA